MANTPANLQMNVSLSDAYLLLDVATPPSPPPNEWLSGYCERNVFPMAIGEVLPNETKTITSAVLTSPTIHSTSTSMWQRTSQSTMM